MNLFQSDFYTAIASTSIAAADETAGSPLVTGFTTTRPPNIMSVRGWRGGSILLAGDVENQGITVNVLAVWWNTPDVADATRFRLIDLGQLIGTTGGTALPSSMPGLPSVGALAWSDSVGWTLDATAGTAFLQSVGGIVTEHDPDDDTPGELFFSDFGSPDGIVIDFEELNTNTIANAFIRRSR